MRVYWRICKFHSEKINLKVMEKYFYGHWGYTNLYERNDCDGMVDLWKMDDLGWVDI